MMLGPCGPWCGWARIRDGLRRLGAGGLGHAGKRLGHDEEEL